jgi:hypothetical protein
MESGSMAGCKVTERKKMDPMNGIWYYLELQRQSFAAKRSSIGAFVRPGCRPNKSGTWLIQLVLPLFLGAALVAFGVVCILCPTFLN